MLSGLRRTQIHDCEKHSTRRQYWACWHACTKLLQTGTTCTTCRVRHALKVVACVKPRTFCHRLSSHCFNPLGRSTPPALREAVLPSQCQVVFRVPFTSVYRTLCSISSGVRRVHQTREADTRRGNDPLEGNKNRPVYEVLLYEVLPLTMQRSVPTHCDTEDLREAASTSPGQVPSLAASRALQRNQSGPVATVRPGRSGQASRQDLGQHAHIGLGLEDSHHVPRVGL